MTLQQQIQSLELTIQSAKEQLDLLNIQKEANAKYKTHKVLIPASYYTNAWLPPKGWGNGYVGITKEHPLFGRKDDGCVVKNNELTLIRGLLEVHSRGGITFSGHRNNFAEQINMQEEDVWFFGFATSHTGDNLETCPKEYVEAETQKLAEILSNWDYPNKYVLTKDSPDFSWRDERESILGIFDTPEEALEIMNRYNFCCLSKI